MDPGPGSQARNDAAHARMAHRDRSALVCEAGGVWARPQATAPTRHLVEVYQDVWLAGCRGDLGGARSRDSALPPGRPRCGQRARLSLSATGGRFWVPISVRITPFYLDVCAPMRCATERPGRKAELTGDEANAHAGHHRQMPARRRGIANCGIAAS